MECSKPNASPGHIEIRILACPSHLCIARAAVRQTCAVFGMGEKDMDAVVLALEEAMTNVIRHSYGGACEKPIVIRLMHRDEPSSGLDELEILLRDYGRQVDPKTIRSRPLDEIRPGGLGVHIIQSVMDESQYSCIDDGGMQLRMVKRYAAMGGSKRILDIMPCQKAGNGETNPSRNS